MAYPTDSLGQVVRSVDSTALSIKLYCQSRVAEMAAGDTTSSAIFQDYQRLAVADAAFANAQTVPGIVAYVRDEKDDQTLDVVAEFLAMRNAIAAARLWIENNFPSTGGYLQAFEFSGGEIVDRTFAPGMTATYRTELNALIATIG